MNEEFIEKILANEEGQTFECKRVLKKPSEVLPTICAFANADGGLFVYGVADKKHFSGNEEKISYWDMVEKYLTENPSISNKQFREISGLDTLKASEFLKRWTKQQLLEKVGKSKKKMVYRKPSTKQFGRQLLLGELF